MFHELYLPHREQLHAHVPQMWRRFAARFGAGERKGPMKIRITGDHPAAETLRGYVKALGCEVLESGRESATAYWIHIELGSLGYVLVRASHGPLLQETILAFGELTTEHVEWLPTFSGSERAIHITAAGADADMIGRALRSALLRLPGHKTKPGSRWKWLGFISRPWKRPSPAN